MKTLEGLALRLLVQEIEREVVGGKIQRVTFPSDWETGIVLLTPSGLRELLISAHPELSVLTLLPSPEKGEPPRNAWQKLLHKYLVGGKIASLRQAGWDRVVEVSIYNPTLWERETEFVFLLELTGRNANLIITRSDPQRTILGALRHIPPEENRWRSILPGIPYTPPPQRKKFDPLELLNQNPTLPETRDLAQWCIHHLDGFGPFLSRFLAELLEYHEMSFVEALKRVLRPFREQQCLFFVFLAGDDRPLGVFWEQTPLLPFSYVHAFRSLNEAVTFLVLAFREHVLERTLQKKREGKLQEDLKFLTEEIQKIDALIPTEDDVEATRLKGELLKILPHLEVLERTPEGVLVQNPLTPSPNKIFIALSPSLSLGENIQEYFKKYRKMRERMIRLQKKRQELEAKRKKIEILLENPRTSEDIPPTSRSSGVSKSIVRFRAPSGNEIWVGKNAWANRLLVRMASRNDYWFHVRDLPGAHVVLKVFHPEALSEDMEKAAQVAAYLSSGKLEAKVEVSCTQVKHLRVLPAREGGKTLYKQEQTFLVIPKYPEELTEI